MEIEVRTITSNEEVVNACRMTVWKSELGHEPSDEFMSNIYFAEHSPIRDKVFVVTIYGIKSWIATHFVRHHEGMTPYVSTQRDDRKLQDVPRDNIGQGALVNMRMTLNAQAFINISRKRLCRQAHSETMAVWKEIIEKLNEVDPILAAQCVPNCIYRGGICPEGRTSCKFNQTSEFKDCLKSYLAGHENSYYEDSL